MAPPKSTKYVVDDESTAGEESMAAKPKAKLSTKPKAGLVSKPAASKPEARIATSGSGLESVEADEEPPKKRAKTKQQKSKGPEQVKEKVLEKTKKKARGARASSPVIESLTTENEPPRKRSQTNYQPSKEVHVEHSGNEKAAMKATTGTTTIRKGMARSASGKASMETPGDPRRPKTFINIDSNEQKLGAYLGFNDVSQLRALTVSWPMLKAFLAFEPIAANMNKIAAFRLVHDSAENFDLQNLSPEWALLPTDTKPVQKSKKARQLAWILVRMESDLKVLGITTKKRVNRAGQIAFSKRMSAEYPDIEIPEVDFLPVQDGLSMPYVYPPELGPYDTETRIESLNRCWSLLKYFRYCKQAKLWQMRFCNILATKTAIDTSHIPRWLIKPQQVERLEVLNKPADVLAADALPPLSIPIRWDTKPRIDGKEDFDQAMALAEEKGITLPDEMQLILQDPRLTETIGSFKDSIRRQFKCQELLIDIHILTLSFVDSTLENGAICTWDILRKDWLFTKALFSDDTKTGFSIRAVFVALDSPDELIYESYDLPPALSTFFTISTSGDLNSNEAGITEIVRAAFDNPKVQQQPIDTDIQGSLPDGSSVPTFIELALGGNAPILGSCPDPMTKFPGPEHHKNLLMYYDGYDVTTEEGKRDWQNRTLNELTCYGTLGSLQSEKLPKTLSKAEKDAIEEAAIQGQADAMAREIERGDGDDSIEVDEERYYTLQTAFSGTSSRAGPPVDVCLRLLDCESVSSGRVKSRLLAGKTSSEFYPYQISGAIGYILKLYGKVNAEVLLEGTGQQNNPCAANIRAAAATLEDLCIHGCILADEVGFGKTKQALLVGFFHTLLYPGWIQNQNQGEPLCYQPILLMVPPALIAQWVEEIRSYWPCFTPVISYSDHDTKDVLSLSNLSHSAMAEYPQLRAIPHQLRYIFDKSDPLAGRVVIVTSYETHKARTANRQAKKIPGIHYKKPRFDANKEPVWKVKPRIEWYWETSHSDVYSLLIADEAQKVRNYWTGLWSVLYIQSIPKTLLATATPMFNSIRDLIALYTLLWPMVEDELTTRCENDETISTWLAENNKNDDLLEKAVQLVPTDPRRLAALSPILLKRIVNSQKGGAHIRIATGLKVILDIAMIQRSLSSILPVSQGNPQPIRGLFKRMIRKTAIVKRTATEEIEYQCFHREAAQEYVNEMKRQAHSVLPKKPTKVNNPAAFIGSARALRKLSIANFATKLARLNRVMELVNGNTHVATLNAWRDRQLEADFIQDLTRSQGEPKATTAKQLLTFLCEGSPPTRLTFHRILAIKAIERLDKARYKRHQKLIVAETLPANALYLQMVLRCALIDARVMHAGLGNKAKGDLVELFNDPKSTLKVLIMMYDVGAVGLNLHTACNEVLISSIARSRAHEAQVSGRALRVTSEFPVTVVRRITPNSHDQFCSARQTGKATIQLAANAHDPAIKALIVRLLNELQPEVDALHESQSGRELKRRVKDKRRVMEAAEATRKHHLGSKEEHQAVTARLADTLVAVPPRKGRSRPTAKLVLPQAQGKSSSPETCTICFARITDEENGGTCDRCQFTGHFECHGVEGTPKEFTCRSCITVGWEIDTAAQDIKKSLCDHEDEEAAADSEVADDEADGDFAIEVEGSKASTSDEEYDSDEMSDVVSEKSDSSHSQTENSIVDEDESEDPKLLKIEELEAFASLEQPDDETRHELALLQFPAYKVWTEKDLEDEFSLKAGLHLLYNAINGDRGVHFSKSIHLHYLSFPADVAAIMSENRRIGSAQRKAAKASVL